MLLFSPVLFLPWEISAEASLQSAGQYTPNTEVNSFGFVAGSYSVSLCTQLYCRGDGELNMKAWCCLSVRETEGIWEEENNRAN